VGLVSYHTRTRNFNDKLFITGNFSYPSGEIMNPKEVIMIVAMTALLTLMLTLELVKFFWAYVL
jgi:hypothetical protein